VEDILRDLFQRGSVSGLQVAGGPAEYYVRVRTELGENSVQAFSLRWWSPCSMPVVILAKEEQEEEEQISG
jgi:hypothetical protein